VPAHEAPDKDFFKKNKKSLYRVPTRQAHGKELKKIKSSFAGARSEDTR
jgi:hypothetical protein